jgi:putative phage-type endonuclease
MPRIERLHQNTPEWHRWRMHGIGASDAPVIMGETPFKTAKTLWALKTGRLQEAPAGPAARRGIELECVARWAYERQTGTQMEPLCLVHQKFEWMRASLDGLSFDGSTLLEIKCPFSPWDRASAQQGRIPSQYYAQLQHQLEVSGAERAHYWSFSGTSGVLIKIHPDREYAKRLIDAENSFWQLVKQNRWPQLADQELDLSADPKWRSAALCYREAKLRLESAAFEEHRLRAALEAMATAKRTFGCGVEVLKSSRKGAIDYSAVPELRGINLESYRKPPVSVVKINFIKPESVIDHHAGIFRIS